MNYAKFYNVFVVLFFMKNMKPSLRFHPFVKRWLDKYCLESEDTWTEWGYVACPAKNRYPQDFQFTFDSLSEDIKKLNSIYGTFFDEEFLDVRHPGYSTMREIIKDFSEVRRASEFFSKFIPETRGIYIGGLCLPNRDFIYVESQVLDDELKDEYSIRDMRPELLRKVTGVPIDKKYRPSIF